GHEYSQESISRRLPLAKNWLTKYNPEEEIVLSDAPNTEYWNTLNDARKEQVKKLREELEKREKADIAELEALVYEIPKSADLDEAALKKEQREFFKAVYNLLIGKDTGPRLGTFLWAVERERARKLLSF